MLTFFSFILALLGTFNWFFIGVFQYDFVAGFFGSQASLLSRLIYFLIGVAGFIMLIMAFKNRGIIKVTENSFRKEKRKLKKDMKEIKEEFDYDKEENKFKNNRTSEHQKNEEGISNVKEDFDSHPSFYSPVEHNRHSEKNFAEMGYKDFDVSQYD